MHILMNASSLATTAILASSKTPRLWSNFLVLHHEERGTVYKHEGPRSLLALLLANQINDVCGKTSSLSVFHERVTKGLDADQIGELGELVDSSNRSIYCLYLANLLLEELGSDSLAVSLKVFGAHDDGPKVTDLTDYAVERRLRIQDILDAVTMGKRIHAISLAKSLIAFTMLKVDADWQKIANRGEDSTVYVVAFNQLRMVIEDLSFFNIQERLDLIEYAQRTLKESDLSGVAQEHEKTSLEHLKQQLVQELLPSNVEEPLRKIMPKLVDVIGEEAESVLRQLSQGEEDKAHAHYDNIKRIIGHIDREDVARRFEYLWIAGRTLAQGGEHEWAGGFFRQMFAVLHRLPVDEQSLALLKQITEHKFEGDVAERLHIWAGRHEDKMRQQLEGELEDGEDSRPTRPVKGPSERD